MIAAAVSGGGNILCYNLFFLLSYLSLKPTVCIILVAYEGGSNPQFVNFRVFKVLLFLRCCILSEADACSFPLFVIGRGYRRSCITNSSRHHDN